ncbi:MAG: NAD-dependent epimerase/dehydratase family protein, partial [Candidatus Binatia bacterium]
VFTIRLRKSHYLTLKRILGIKMKIIILTDRLWNQFHSLVLLSRKPPAEVGVSKKEWFAWTPPAGGEWEKAVEGSDGIINLAGEPIAGKRWTKEQKEKLRSSRIDTTRALVSAIGKTKVKPKFLVNASAVGYYGPHGDESGHHGRVCQGVGRGLEPPVMGVRAAFHARAHRR